MSRRQPDERPRQTAGSDHEGRNHRVRSLTAAAFRNVVDERPRLAKSRSELVDDQRQVGDRDDDRRAQPGQRYRPSTRSIRTSCTSKARTVL